MPRLTRRLLAAGFAAAALIAAAPAAAVAAPAQALPAAAVVRAAADPYEQKLAVAVKFGFGDNTALLEKDDRDFVIELWKLLDGKSDHLEVVAAAEQAFTTSFDACTQFIVTDVYAAFDRDVARELREKEEKRQSDVARATAAAAIDITADATLLNATDERFAELIWEAVKDDAKWPKVKAAASAAGSGSAEEQREFIATGLAAAAKEDVEDRIRRDEEQTEAERIAALARAAKQFAANRIGLPVTEELLNLPDQDFVVTVWNFAPDGTEVQIAASNASRSLDAAVWKAFIDTGIHQAKDRDIQKAAEKKAAEERRLVEELLARAEKAGQVNLPTAARKALAGTPEDVTRFLYTGQYEVAPDRPDALSSGVRFGRVTKPAGGCLDVAWAKTANATSIQLNNCNGNAAQDITSPGDGSLRVLGKCVDSGGPATGSAGDRLVYLWGCNGTAAQKWQQRPNGTLYQPGTERCLESTANAVQLFISTCNNGDGQKWNIPNANTVRFGKLTVTGGKCADVSNSATANGTKIQAWSCNGTAAQDVTVPGDGSLRVFGKCVDGAGPATGDAGDRLVYLWGCNGTAAQMWQLRADGTVYQPGTDRCLDAGTAQLYINACDGSANQKWTLPPVAKPGFGSITGVSSKCLDAAGGANANGTVVQIYTCNTGSAQQVTSPGDGTLRIGGACVDLGTAIGSVATERRVQLYGCNGTATQQWHQRADGTVYNTGTSFCLDVQSTANSTQLYTHACNTGANQKWKIPVAA
ncbi:ricin-type beta-trefoil lectin domain protein [Actinoplanes sp. NBC_00393]|uniref:ricin-type beta-trefoil lectin domain protein n=1 Tax=Actinoplanes sp. NBC_00393 TaxID=2975953 RepID=UPI002E1B2670